MNNQVLADSYAIILLDSLDGVNGDDRIKVTPKVTRNQMQNSILVFQVTLPYKRLWNYTVLAHGCEQYPVMSNTILSKNSYFVNVLCVLSLFSSGTHDVQSILVTSLTPGDIRVTSQFIQGSTAAGVVIADISSSGIRFYLLARESDQLELDGTFLAS